MTEICLVVGARPNFMKVAPVYRALKALDLAHEITLVHTGQHYDAEMSDVFVTQLRLPAPDTFLGVGSGTHAQQTARALVGLETIFLERRPVLIVVAGDVNSTLAAALAGAKVKIPIAHIESGLRSFDPAMPEEQNRKLTDHLSTILLAHSASAVENLDREGIASEAVHLVGNTMIDSVLEHLEHARDKRPWETFGVDPGTYGLVTLHRPELVDDPDSLRRTVASIIDLAEAFPLVFPIHPRTLERLGPDRFGDELQRSAVIMCEPLGYLDFLGLEAEARFVLTDSGGVQEETSALGVPCFTLRDSTERPVTIELGTNTLLGRAPERIAEIPGLLVQSKPREPIPLWDGDSGSRAAEIVARFLDGHVATSRATQAEAAG